MSAPDPNLQPPVGDSGASLFQTRAVLAAVMTFVANPAHVNRPGHTCMCGAASRKHPPRATYMTLPCGRQRSGTRIADEMTQVASCRSLDATGQRVRWRVERTSDAKRTRT